MEIIAFPILDALLSTMALHCNLTNQSQRTTSSENKINPESSQISAPMIPVTQTSANFCCAQAAGLVRVRSLPSVQQWLVDHFDKKDML